jgi:uncharacterized linocin/CFP29 family protein
MDRLHRSLAPISDEAWHQIDDEAARTLRHYLAGRALVEVDGPKGWTHSAESRGDTEPPVRPFDGVEARLRVVQPLAELRVPFEMPTAEIDRIDRGAANPNLDPVTDAARLIARAEDRIIFHGQDSVGVAGIATASTHDAIPIPDDYNLYPGVVAQAVSTLKRAAIEGPYAIALGERCYTGVIETTEHGGYPLLDHLKMILGGPVVWAPAVDGAVVVSQRGGDYTFALGDDLAIGFGGTSATGVRLYLEESFTLVICEDRAAVALVYT